MSIHEEYGYEEPSLEPFYEGLFVENSTIYARTGCFYNGKRILADNDLHASMDMVLFSIEAGEPLNKETEIRPLVDLVFANIAVTLGLDGAINPDGSTKTCEMFLNDGLDKLEKIGLAPKVPNQIKALLDENKSLWPQELLPLVRTFKNISNKPLRLHKISGLDS